MTQERREPIEAQAPGSGPGREARRVRKSSTASAEELREFLRRMRGRSPQEMLGVVAQSGLVRSTIASIVIFALILAACTVGPYWLERHAASVVADDVAAPTAAASDADDKATDENVVAAGAASDAGDSGDSGDEAVPDGDAAASGGDVLEKLGIGETKDPDAVENPLESRNDDLLDGLDE